MKDYIECPSAEKQVQKSSSEGPLENDQLQQRFRVSSWKIFDSEHQ